MLRIFLGGDGQNFEMHEVRRGVQAICEEPGLPAKVRDSAYYDDSNRYMRRSTVVCARLEAIECDFSFKIDGWFMTTDRVSIGGTKCSLESRVEGTQTGTMLYEASVRMIGDDHKCTSRGHTIVRGWPAFAWCSRVVYEMKRRLRINIRSLRGRIDAQRE